eukprot:TRINITY_DN2881_c0_g3_i1.p1 TRINITY_DN2881_c0_g3~~TRINITY_DN2881_c0_g3_i1.p1  ORF type:complete len:232 (+),score=45.97 TRINITY_DN2881_c0_g3_i1:84-698(+)
MEPFEKMESSLNSLESFLRGVGHTSGEELYGVNIPCTPSVVVLTEMHTSSGDADTTLQPQSPKMHPSSPGLREMNSSPELAESTNNVENPVNPPIELNVGLRPKVSEIDVNCEPTAPEIQSTSKRIMGTSAFAMPTGANDVFWEQFLTETPGSADVQEVQSERQENGSRDNERKPADQGNYWWNKKNVDHLTEQMGQLTPAERT